MSYDLEHRDGTSIGSISAATKKGTQFTMPFSKVFISDQLLQINLNVRFSDLSWVYANPERL
jgi:hypothetical protein